MATPDTSQRNSAQLESELEALRKYKHQVENRNKTKSKAQIFFMKLWVGPDLSQSIEEWMTVKESNDPAKTVSATANLLAAVLRRFIRVSFVFIFVALIPIVLIIWQNIIMERQNQSLIAQIKAERTASSNQQVTEYLRLLLSSDARQVAAAEGFLVSDLVNRDIAVERLAALIKSGNSTVQCSALRALTGIIKYPSDTTLKEVIAPLESERTTISDLQCENIDFTGVDFGPMTFIDVGFSHSKFTASDLSAVEFQRSNLRHSDFSETNLCTREGRCVKFQNEVDLSFASLTFTNRSKDVFPEKTILKGTQLKFDRDDFDGTKSTRAFGRAQSSKLTIPKLSKQNMIATGVCYETGFSQCYLYHKTKDLGQLSSQKLESLRHSNCPINLEGPIVLTSISSCENLGLKRRW